MANPVKKCVLHGVVNNETADLYPRTNLASVTDMTAFTRTLNGATDAATARKTLGIQTSKDIINIIYPVGSVITLTNDTDPNELYQGTTWVKMDAGRVLVSAGTYTEGSGTYTYTLGEKGGEAKHQLTTEELPAHSHPLSISAVESHTHRILFSDRDHGYGDMRAGGDDNHGLTKITESAGEHTHTGIVASVGNGHSFNIMQPYEAINRWKRIS